MYAKLNNGQIEIYPYTIGQLRKDNHNVSFPRNISSDVLASFNVVEVKSVNPPTVDHTKVWRESTPVLENGVWKQSYVVSDVSAEDLSSRTIEQAQRIRSDRDKRLAETDWTQLIDSPFSNDTNGVWQAYRQALRDVPAQEGFPWDVTWPEVPGNAD